MVVRGRLGVVSLVSAEGDRQGVIDKGCTGDQNLLNSFGGDLNQRCPSDFDDHVGW